MREHPTVAAQVPWRDVDPTASTTCTSYEALRRQVPGSGIHARHEASLEGRLAQSVQSYSEPFAIRARKIKSRDVFIGSFCYLLGPVMGKTISKSGEEVFSISPMRSAFGWGLTVIFPSLSSKVLRLAVVVFREIRQSQTWSMRWFLSFPTIVPQNAPIMEWAKLGDTSAIKMIFETSKAAPTDVTSNGTSLLHVCKPNNTRTDKKILT